MVKEARVTNPMDRRSFLRRGALGVAGVTVLPTLLAACGSDSNDSSSDTTAAGASSSGGGTKDLGTLDYQFSWIKNVEFAGEYLADANGYYEKVGFSKVNFMSGGPSVQQDAVVASGKALVGVSAPDITSSAIAQGAGLIAIGAQYQKNPFCVMSLAESPIATPEDMYGKKIGVQSTNEAVWNAFVKAAGLDASKINKVPVQFDPQPLVNKEVDGWFSFITNEPNTLKTKGIDTVTFLLNDHGYPMVSEIIVVKKSSLQSDRAKVMAVLEADCMGWTDSYKDPAAAPKLVVATYGKDLGLDEAEQVMESKAQNELIFTDDVKANGLFTITDQLVEETIKTLGVAGIKTSASKLFDLSLLEELYKSKPELVSGLS
jgi:ABC-type nitrate/sulfonate/bicarbonate transport system substrate-binding protein